MRNISWCPCLKVRVNFLPQRNYAAHFTVICIYFYVPSGHFIAHFVARKCIAHWNKNVQQMIYKIAAKIPRVS